MVTHYRCQNEHRLQTARFQPGVDGQYVNGIDYMEVLSDQQTVIVHLLHPLLSANPLNQDNIKITDEKDKPISIASAAGFGRLLTIRIKQIADPSAYYCLCLIESPLKRLQRGELDNTEPIPPQGFDPQLCKIQFSFRATGISEVDCQSPEASRDNKPISPPVIDYLAKDYASFRQLMLDRLTITMPKWRERSPADIGVMLVELLAYAADHLSYYQDAVATEAYLGTARRRMSVRRHARLLDYFMHDGCNARAWVAITVSKPNTSLQVNQQSNTEQPFNPRTDGIKLPGPSKDKHKDKKHSGTRFFTKVNGLKHVLNPNNPKDQEDILKALSSDALVFETLEDITLYEPCNEIHFYTWGEEECYLPAGVIQATLKDTGGKLQQCLAAGRVLILEEYRRPETGQKEGRDLTHRHAVRLKKVTSRKDPLLREEGQPQEGTNQAQRVLEVEWDAEDALPFQLCISKRINGVLYSDMSVVRGNVVLVDHGRTYPDYSPIVQKGLEKAKAEASQDAKIMDAEKLNRVVEGDRYRPHLKYGPLTQQRYELNQQGKWILFDLNKSARDAIGWLPQDAYTGIALKEYNVESNLAAKEYKTEEVARESLDSKRHFIRPAITLTEYNAQSFPWNYEPDLLNSERFARDFVVETEEDGRAYLRFGDDVLGKRPEVGSYFEVTYRVGNGSIGNVGAEAIAHIVTNLEGIQCVRNPLPAQGGIDPESIEQVRLYAPQAFRVPQRAVTEADYVQIAERFPNVQRAMATRRWTGSWYTIFLTVDRRGGRSLDEQFKTELRAFLERFRMAGHDLEIEEPRYAPLKISMNVQVKPGYFRNSVKQALLDTFSDRVLPNHGLGFFHPDQLTFGQPIYLSQVIQMAVQVDGVQSVKIKEFQRWGKPSQGELKIGRISVAPLEIAQLNNDPANPSRGQIEFDMEGGL